MNAGGASGSNGGATIEQMARAFVPELAALNEHVGPLLEGRNNTLKRDEAVNDPAQIIDNGASFDQRPGTFEATRSLGPVLALGTRIDGQGPDAGWRIQLCAGGVWLKPLTPGEARGLAGELVGLAQLIEGIGA